MEATRRLCCEARSRGIGESRASFMVVLLLVFSFTRVNVFLFIYLFAWHRRAFGIIRQGLFAAGGWGKGAFVSPNEAGIASLVDSFHGRWCSQRDRSEAAVISFPLKTALCSELL
jgi:hypothetical protein